VINPRDEVMADIYKKADDLNHEEEPEQEPEELKEEPVDEEPVIEAPDEEPEEEEYVTIKVDGEERTVPLSDVIDAGRRSLQKESAADKRLAEASELLKAAKEKVSGEPGEEPDPSEGQDGTDDIGHKLERALYGDDGEVAEIVNELASKIDQRGDTTDENDLIEKAVIEVERRSAMSDFKSDEKYAKINEDKALFRRWDTETAILREENPDWPLLRIAREAGDRINNMVGNVTTASALDAKRRATKMQVKSSVNTRSQGEPEYKPKTPSEIVEEIRRARGQV